MSLIEVVLAAVQHNGLALEKANFSCPVVMVISPRGNISIIIYDKTR
jgi:hypothetical protein